MLDSGDGLLKHVAIAVLAGILAVSCAAREDRGDASLLDFITDGQTSRTEALLALGQPSASFEHGRVLTYRIGGDSLNGYFVRDAPGTWYETNYSLVLVFCPGGLLESHALVRVR